MIATANNRIGDNPVIGHAAQGGKSPTVTMISVDRGYGDTLAA